MKSQDTNASDSTSFPIDPDYFVDAGPRISNSVKSAGRVLQILEFFDEVQRDARVAEIAAGLNIPQSSTSMLLKCLVEIGYLEYLPATRSFLPSPRVTLLGTWLDKGPVRNGSLIRMLEELSNTTGRTIILAARNRLYSQYIHVVQSRLAMRFHVPSNSRRLVVWSATGFCLLLDAPDKEIRALCHRTNAEAPEGQAKIDVAKTLENVHFARKEGYSFSKGLVTPGAGSIAIPLPGGIDTHERPLAVAMSGYLDEFLKKEKEIVALIRDAIRRYFPSETAASAPPCADKR